MRDPMMLFDCRLSEAALEAVREPFLSGRLASGPAVPGLETDLGDFLDAPHVVAMGDMTQALALALRLAGVGQDDEVLTLSFNCMSSNVAIGLAGARPVWVDVEPDTATFSVADAAAALTPRTKAVVVYHVSGYPADLPAIRGFCDAHGLPLIEDANNALGATFDGVWAGKWGDYSVYSFYANRQLNGIEGAALLCPDAETAARARRLRRFGIDAARFRDLAGEIDPSVDVEEIGLSASLNNVNAALARFALGTLAQRISRSRRNAESLVSRLGHLQELRPIGWNPGAAPAFWTWLVRCGNRDRLMDSLKDAGIACSRLHFPNHHYSGFGASARPLPGTLCLQSEMFALPCGWWLDAASVERLAATVEQSFAAVGAD
jgi:dTDP-4-amino-4,6-dideoxygalactose transaminase